MYEILALGALWFICKKLKETGIPEFLLRIFALLMCLWLILGFVAGFDFSYAEYDLMPFHTAEIIRAVNINVVIITLFAFLSFLGVSILTKFKPFTKTKTLLALLLTVCLVAYSMFEAYNVQARHVTVSTKKLPQGTDRLRVVFMTDMHIGGVNTLTHFEHVMKIVDEAEPDLILLGGDTFDGDLDYRKSELEMLKAAGEKARYGAFAVNGNHEHYIILDVDHERIIRECGYDLLINERRETAGITIIGLDDVKYGWITPYLEAKDRERFVLVLKHRPGIPNDAEGNFDLQLSGHTHGGQFWPLGYFKDRALNSVQGLSRKAGGYVYVSNGVGFNAAMMRLFVPPEVTVIDIVREE